MVTRPPEVFVGILDRFEREVQAFGRFPSYFLGLANDAGEWEHYDGHLKVVDSDGAIVVEPPFDEGNRVARPSPTTATSSKACTALDRWRG